MEQTVSQVVVHVVNILTGYITKHLRYVTSSRIYVTDMRNKMEVLEGKRKDVNKHMERNKINNKEIPANVEGWLEKVEKIKKDVANISTVNERLNVKKRYRAGKNAMKTVKEIERLMNEEKEISWSEAYIPLGRVDSEPSSNSTQTTSGETTQNDFKSREKIFKDALKFLQQDDKTCQVMALWGMGGIGKTTMMEQLKKFARANKMFDWIIKIVVGQKPNMLSIQTDIAVQIDLNLPEASESVRSDLLCKKIENLSKDRKKILLILDDVWELIKLKDIGLPSPLPNSLKLLLTSRNYDICKKIAVDANSSLKEIRVHALEEEEAKNFFFQIAEVSEHVHPSKYLIGCNIIKKCGYLPLAIKLIASTLKAQEDYVWRDALSRLKNNDLDKDVQEIMKISYEHIQEDEDKEIFLHCGLFPEDYAIPTEYLMRYAWGLKLLKNISTLSEARDRTNKCVRNLINSNLLIESDQPGCVKMHDLVLAFVVGKVSSSNPTWKIYHGNVSKWGRDESCQKTSVTCRGMSEFPRDFKYPNLSLLQLMHGDLSLKFPKDFYENMENLEVIAYYKMQYPLLPRSLQSSTQLRTLFLHECKLMFDCSFLGDLVNLEVLSLSHCGIHKLPSKIGNLKRLKLLDLTGCVDLRIDDGVFKNLHSLEELYMKVSDDNGIRFTNANIEELKMLSSQLCALEVEFLREKSQLKNMSFKKLDKFKISIGCLLGVDEDMEKYLFENSLVLVTGCSYLLDCEISELFKKTEKLSLLVADMTRLEDVSHHPYNQHSFFYLRGLEVSDCVELNYLFPIVVARGLRNLEFLKITSCSKLKALVESDGSEINSSGETIKLEKLKFLSLGNLPEMVCMFPIENVVELPELFELEVDELPNFTSIYPDQTNNVSASQPLLNNQVKISKLKILKIYRMEKLKQIWACSSHEEEFKTISTLREIEVRECDSLVNLFPTNPMRLLNHLEELTVEKCGSVEMIFNIDLECAGGVEQVSNNLRSIKVTASENLQEVWRIKGGKNNSSGTHGFENIFNNAAFPSSLIPTNFPHQLSHLNLEGSEKVKVVFEIISTDGDEPATTLFPYLEDLTLKHMETMTHVWKCDNWNKLMLSLQKQHPQSSSFHNLTTISIRPGSEKHKKILGRRRI